MSRQIPAARLAVLFGLLVAAPLARAAPLLPVYTSASAIPACYNRTNGQLRLVTPWLPAGCDPSGRTQANRYGTCAAGGAYDCRTNELFLDLGRGPQGPTGPKGDQGVPGPQGPAGDGGPVSGTRLKVLQGTFAGEDGSRLPNAMAQFYDTALGVYCTPERAADGELRCLPVATDFASLSTVYFMDPACTQRVAAYAQAGTSGCAPKFAYDPITNPQICDGGWQWYPGAHYYELGRVLGPDQAFYSNESGTCVASGRPGNASWNELYEVGAEVPASAFVKISVR
jgi:hypothetical protein